jgi:KaiC/GvpD/RAD55 family RecA-like ATPase
MYMTKVAFSDQYVDETAEWELLAGLLHKDSSEYLHRMTDKLFTEERKRVFDAMREAYQAYGYIDVIGIEFYLNGNIPGELLSARGATIRSAFDTCARLATKREAKKKAEEFGYIASMYNPSDEDIVRALSFQAITAAEDSSMTTGAIKFLGDLNAKRSKTYRFAKTGLPWLDVKMHGEWKPKSLVVIAAPPGVGKTTLVANSMLYMAKNIDKETGELDPTASLHFSLEMSKEDFYTKWAADTLNIDGKDIARGKLSDEDAQRVEDTVELLQSYPIRIIDNSRITLFKIVNEIRQHVVQYGTRVVFLDYIQIVNHAPTGNTNSDLGEVAEVLKSLAKELNITIVVLSQLNRGGQGLDKIRDSGEIAQVADVVILMEPESESSGVVSIVVNFLKNRFGPVGMTTVLFYGPYQRFEGMTEEVYG